MFIKTSLILLLSSYLFAMSINEDPAFKAIYNKERNSDKILLMMYSTESCPQCSYMKLKVFKDPKVAMFLNKHFVVLEKDVQKENLAEGFDYFGIPTIFFVDENGTQHGKFIGSARAKPFLQELEKVVQERVKR